MNKMSHLHAIGLAIGSFALWVGADSCMKLAGEAALPPYEVVAYMGIFGLSLIVLQAAIRRGFSGVRALWPQQPQQQMGRAALSLITVACNTIALKYLPLTLFYVTVFTAPMIVALLASVFLKEKLTTGKMLAIVAGFMGVLIAIDPLQDFARGEWIGYAMATLSTISFAISVVWLRNMTQSETPESITFFTALVESLVCGAFMVGHADPLTPQLLLILVAMATLCVVGNVGFYAALKHTTATNVSQFHYTQIVTGALVGYLVWHDVPTMHLWIGAALISAAGLYIANHARKQAVIW